MLSIRIALVATMLALPAVACGPSHHDNPAPDDASPAPVYDAMPRPDAGPPPDAEVDAGIAAAPRGRGGAVAGGVKASSAHYKLVGTASEGGSAPSSPSYQLRTGVDAEGQKP